MHEFAPMVDHPAYPEPVAWHGEERILMLGRPQSVNALGARGSRFAQAGQKKSWQDVTTKLLMEKVPRERFAYVEAAAELRYEKGIARFDEDNFRAPIAKFLGDAFDGGSSWRAAGGRWLPDDSSEFFRLRGVDYRVVRKLAGARLPMPGEGEQRIEAPSTLIVFRYLERCPNEFGPAVRNPRHGGEPVRAMCALPNGHVGECLSMKGARAAFADPPPDWRNVRP